MQTSKWGNRGWKFLHCLPLLCPDSMNAEVSNMWIAFLESLQDMLPCKYCRASYKTFLSEAHPSGCFKNFKPDQCQLATAFWLYEVHNKVNKKLDKPQCKTFSSTCCDVQNFSEWELAFWDFILTIIWNFDSNDQWRRDAYANFFNLLPKILAKSSLGVKLSTCLMQRPLGRVQLNSDEAMKHWGFQLWNSCHQTKSANYSDFASMNTFFESWRSNMCSLDASTTQSC